MKKQLVIFGIIVLLITVGLSGCTGDTDFEVHEWGVFIKGYNCDEILFSGMPGFEITNIMGDYIFLPGINADDVFNNTMTDYIRNYSIKFRKPVIYFHSIEEKTNIKVQINSIKNVTVIPNATIKENTISWDIDVENDIIKLDDGSEYRYLFYEGENNYPTHIDADIIVNNSNVTFRIKNMEKYSISDVYFIYGKKIEIEFPDNPLFNNLPGTTYIYLDNLDSDEEKNITIEMMNESFYNASEMIPQLINQGLTENESKELVDYWKEYWFYPNLDEYSRIIYTIPQSEYDKLLPISITPQPTTIKRVGIITLTDIPLSHY